ncbi:hypothetical protein HYS28_02140 [Candidatus Uhrbacteria bacterium]|nr:hypothetical protein [Candidatus Uhrbacteria bacterium]
MTHRVFRALLAVGASFYTFEAALHGFGLAVLEHDKIFLPTHDRYIAIFALTYAALLVLIASNPTKHRSLFILTMAGILLSMGNAALIAAGGGYASFGVLDLDADLSAIGIGAIIWFVATIVCAVPLYRK